MPHKEGRTGSKLNLDLEVAGGGEGVGIVGDRAMSNEDPSSHQDLVSPPSTHIQRHRYTCCL